MFQNALFAVPPQNSQMKTTPVNLPDDSARQQPINTDNPPFKENANAKGKGRKKATVSPSIGGLDTSIVIDPRRMHMTLGVMALELDIEQEKPSPDAGQNKGKSLSIQISSIPALYNIPLQRYQ